MIEVGRFHSDNDKMAFEVLEQRGGGGEEERVNYQDAIIESFQEPSPPPNTRLSASKTTCLGNHQDEHIACHAITDDALQRYFGDNCQQRRSGTDGASPWLDGGAEDSKIIGMLTRIAAHTKQFHEAARPPSTHAAGCKLSLFFHTKRHNEMATQQFSPRIPPPEES